MVILWGLEEDRPLEVVRDALEALGAPTVFLDQRRQSEYALELAFDAVPTGRISGPDVSIDLASVRAAYLRPYNFEQLDAFEGVTRGSEPWNRAAQFEDALYLWSELTPVRVVNRPSAMASNGSKPFQLELIRKAGFEVPDTFVTTDPDSVIEFRRRHGRIIFKSVSSTRSIVRQFVDDDLATLDDVTCCPTQFQQFIEGVDYRVHVVGDKVFPSRITSSADDFRYSSETRIDIATLPDDIVDACLTLTRSLDLFFSGIDLRRSVNGRWYCFEANASPGFTYFNIEGQQIGLAVADFLAS